MMPNDTPEAKAAAQILALIAKEEGPFTERERRAGITIMSGAILRANAAHYLPLLRDALDHASEPELIEELSTEIARLERGSK
jgi:hypothetical protein